MTQNLSKPGPNPRGFLNFTLHAHLPYVVNHGTWPHGMEWLLEAAAETYLPLLRMLASLERDNIRFHCNLNLTPILLEQLAHPAFIAEFPHYASRKIVAAIEDEAYFIQAGDHHLAETARFWHRYFTQALEDFQRYNGNIVAAFRHFSDTGLIDIITCGATHGYMPLLGTDESLRAQIRTAVETHIRHIGKPPRGMWSPECGYRPAGRWSYPVSFADGVPTPAGFDRIGIEQALAESGIEFFVVDTHLVENSLHIPSPYDLQEGASAPPLDSSYLRALYQPYYVDGPYSRDHNNPHATTIFPRDPRTGVQVWSGDNGYPGDPAYLDFHKKRWPGGHRYWRVTGSKVEMGDKEAYHPNRAPERVRAHAAHYVELVRRALEPGFDDAVPPILCSPFDAELFGHWWFEGIQWLEAVARHLHQHDSGIQLMSCGEYLDRYPRAGAITMHEGSWGAEGANQVWMNPDTSWTYTHIYPAETLHPRRLHRRHHLRRPLELSPRQTNPPATLPRAPPARILRLAVPHHHRRRPRLRRDPLPHPPRSVQRRQSHLPDLRIRRRHLPRTRHTPRRNRTPRQHLPQHRPHPLGRRLKTRAPHSPTGSLRRYNLSRCIFGR